jgi:hypothetical protein
MTLAHLRTAANTEGAAAASPHWKVLLALLLSTPTGSAAPIADITGAAAKVKESHSDRRIAATAQSQVAGCQP